MTRAGLAFASGIAETDLVSLENGQLDPSYTLIGRFSRALGVEPPNFFATEGGNLPFWAYENDEGLELRFKHGGFDASYLLEGATQDQFEQVLGVLKTRLARSGNRVRTRAVAETFLHATRVWPDANPSDLWLFFVNRSYCDRTNHPAGNVPADVFQSWNRTSGYALEDVLVAHYGEHLRGRGLFLHSVQSEKVQLLKSLANPDVIADKADILVSRASGARRELAGLINVKASLAERRTDDVPLSQQLIDAGRFSIFWTLDCKSFPAKNPVNRGEYGSDDEDAARDKRLDIEVRGNFSACFSYNLNTIPTAREDAVSRIYVCDFRDPDDDFSRFVIGSSLNPGSSS